MITRSKLRWRIQHWLENHVPGLMTCAEFGETVDAYLDGELGPVASALVDLHIRTCPACERYLAAYRKTRDLAVATVTAEDDAVLEDLPEDLVTAILAARDAEAGRPMP